MLPSQRRMIAKPNQSAGRKEDKKKEDAGEWIRPFSWRKSDPGGLEGKKKATIWACNDLLRLVLWRWGDRRCRVLSADRQESAGIMTS